MNILARSELGTALLKGGVPFSVWNAAAIGGSVQGNLFGTVSREWVDQVWDAAMETLRLNAPHLVEIRQLGNGRSRAVPRYFLNGFNCRGHSLYVYAHGLMGVASAAADTEGALPYDGLAWGFMHYTARPRPDNLLRDGRHEQLWFIDHDGVFQSFEGGDGEENEMTPEELSSIDLVYAQ